MCIYMWVSRVCLWTCWRMWCVCVHISLYVSVLICVHGEGQSGVDGEGSWVCVCIWLSVHMYLRVYVVSFIAVGVLHPVKQYNYLRVSVYTLCVCVCVCTAPIEAPKVRVDQVDEELEVLWFVEQCSDSYPVHTTGVVIHVCQHQRCQGELQCFARHGVRLSWRKKQFHASAHLYVSSVSSSIICRKYFWSIWVLWGSV